MGLVIVFAAFLSLAAGGLALICAVMALNRKRKTPAQLASSRLIGPKPFAALSAFFLLACLYAAYIAFEAASSLG